MTKENKNHKKDSRSHNPDKYPARWEDTPIRDVFNRVFDDNAWLEPFDFLKNTPRALSELRRSVFPKVDISETDTEIKVIADVPGINPDNIDIEVRDNRIKISGTVERENEFEEKPYRYERSYGEFRREFMLPTRVKEDQIKAICKDGVLTVTLPKVEEEKHKKIAIEKQ